MSDLQKEQFNELIRRARELTLEIGNGTGYNHDVLVEQLTKIQELGKDIEAFALGQSK